MKMAGFHTKTFIKHDDYMTPKYAWENIAHLIPRDKIIWEAFYSNGKSGEYLRELGFDCIHEPIDFFEHDLGEIIVSNPPFSKVKEILKRLAILDKPFILILPSSKINTSYFREWRTKGIQIIIPRKRINFEKHVEGKALENWVDHCNFDTFYYTYKMGFEKDIIWLE
jgi:hypothetical protein